MARTGTPPREKARVYRTGRPDRLCSLLFAVAALILCAGIGAVLWHEWQGTRPTAAEQAEADEIERADGGEEEIAAVTEEAADGKIVVAIDPGHGGVNPSVGSEDAGSLGSGLREADVTLKTATLVYDKLVRDGRFAPMLTANGTEYLKPSRRAARAKAVGAPAALHPPELRRRQPRFRLRVLSGYAAAVHKCRQPALCAAGRGKIRCNGDGAARHRRRALHLF